MNNIYNILVETNNIDLIKPYYDTYDPFDIQMGYFSYLNYLQQNGIVYNHTQKFIEIRKDYEFKQNVKRFYNERCVISDADIDECSICHIKPFCECDENEKYDYNNGIILSDSLHKLFDKYYFTIHPENFNIIVLDNVKNKKLCINEYVNKKIYINNLSKNYLYYHYNNFIKINKIM